MVFKLLVFMTYFAIHIFDPFSANVYSSPWTCSRIHSVWAETWQKLFRLFSFLLYQWIFTVLMYVPYSIFLPCVLLRSQFCQFYNQILRHWLSLIIWHFKTFCKKPIFIFLCFNLPMMTHLSEPGAWYMRGPPESPEHGSCHSPLLNSSSVPNILLCLYVVWDTLRLTLLRNGLCWRVHRSCLLSVVNLNYLTGF